MSPVDDPGGEQLASPPHGADEPLLARLRLYQTMLDRASAEHYRLPPHVRATYDGIPIEVDFDRLAHTLAHHSTKLLEGFRHDTQTVLYVLEGRRALTLPSQPHLHLVQPDAG